MYILSSIDETVSPLSQSLCWQTSKTANNRRGPDNDDSLQD